MNVSKDGSLLNTAFAIKRALGATYGYLRKRDPLKIGRRQRNILKDAPPMCAACGRSNKELQVAHIKALELRGGNEPKNLVHLCHGRKRKGCHELYDAGYASPQEMRTARTKWLAQKADGRLRSAMQALRDKHDKDEIAKCKGQGHLVKALRCVEDKRCHTTDATQAFELRIRALELQRRRTARGALELADQRFSELLPDVPQRLRSQLYYEGGCIAQIRGQHEEARRRFKKGRAAIDCSAGWEWKHAAATSKIVQTTVILLGAKSPWDKLRAQLCNAARLAKGGHDPVSQRWALNCQWNVARLSLAEGELDRAEAAWQAAATSWDSVTVERGWDIGVHWTAVAIRAQIAADRATLTNAQKVVPDVARAIVAAVGRAGRYPEGIRDTLFAAARVFYLLGYPGHSVRAKRVAERTQDGSSWVHPYQA